MLGTDFFRFAVIDIHIRERRDHQQDRSCVPVSGICKTGKRKCQYADFKSIRQRNGRIFIPSWGIYDDSPEMNLAIAISDAYYGDPSSVVEVYKATGKPIMLQNVEVL